MTRKILTLGALALAAALAGSWARAAIIDVEVPDPLSAGAMPADAAGAWMAATAAREGRAFALASDPAAADGALQATAAAIGSRSLPTPSTINLWTFITSVRAQQQGDRFVILQTHASLLQLAEAPPAAVPLPGALWLMVMGLLGIAGVRVTGQGALRAGLQPAMPRPLLPAV